jgi:hypothetical protein
MRAPEAHSPWRCPASCPGPAALAARPRHDPSASIARDQYTGQAVRAAPSLLPALFSSLVDCPDRILDFQ